MVDRPSGTVTFLFTDIEGSTRMWAADGDAMRTALASHDHQMRVSVEAHDGWVFKHTGDGVCAAFASARAAIAAAVEAQRALELPVRMGVATGEAEERDGDYFGMTLNRAARVMGAAHGGQILVPGSTAALVDDVDLLDLGEHRLRDIGGATRLYQVMAEGLVPAFPPLRTLDALPGSLPVQVTSFLGRETELKEVSELARAHRLVTLTGVGGVGKTRLAVQVAADLSGEFPDGVWLVELAPVGDPASVPDVVATTLGVTPEPGSTVSESVARALSGRRLLVVLDNCEHVLAAAAEVLNTIMTRATTVKMLTTSRERLRLEGERVWAVPSLDVQAGRQSAAVQLFVERAQAVNPGFELENAAQAAAVTEICHRLDGIALAIELAAARMMSMGAEDVRDRLDDRFRLLSGAGRGLQHHQTLRRAVSWSYDLLDRDEQRLLNRCSVFSDGFDVSAATYICGGSESDEYAVLDLLDALVRKSLITTEQTAGRSRYGVLETIRQFAEEQLEASGSTNEVRQRHAEHFAQLAMSTWDVWNGPDQRDALDWVDRELANLRAGFRWAADHGELACATAIAAHAALLSFMLQRFEPVGWAEEILPAAVDAELPQLPRLLTAASVCALTGRPDVATGYAESALALEADPRYDPFETGWSSFWAACGNRYSGRIEQWFEICNELAARDGLAHVIGLVGLLAVLPGVGRSAEAKEIADETLAAARALGNPCWIAFALTGVGRAYADTDPARAMETMDQCLDYSRAHRLSYFEAATVREIASLEEVLGDPEVALELFETAVALYHRAGNHGSVATTLADMAVLFSRIDRPEIAAIIYGTSTRHGINLVVNLPEVLNHLRTVLTDDVFDQRVAAGAAMDFNDAMEYVRGEIALARRQLAEAT